MVSEFDASVETVLSESVATTGSGLRVSMSSETIPAASNPEKKRIPPMI